MAKIEPIEFRMPIGDMVHNLILRVTVIGKQRFRARLWLGLQLMKLAGWIIGCQTEVSVDESKSKAPAPRTSLAIPPVHFSVDELVNGRANITWDEARRILVKVDNQEIQRVVAYDCAAGWVDRHELLDGETLVRDDKVAIERIHGTVTAEWRETL